MTNLLALSVYDTSAMGVLATMQATLRTALHNPTPASVRTARCQPMASGPSSLACYVSDA
jgi:hypothetical protein